MNSFFRFVTDTTLAAFVGSQGFYYWLLSLSIATIAGLVAYSFQLHYGLEVTALTDQVSWGCYIANFTFLVGVAAAAVLLVFPAYILGHEGFRKVVIIGEMLAISAILMALMFVAVDLGRPERFWHILPVVGRLNFPSSILAWDVIALNGYLVLNLHIVGYVLYCRYHGLKPRTGLYLPWVFLSIIWAVSIHTVTAFLYTGLGSRPFWNSSILAARFLVSAFAAGPAILLIIFHILANSRLFAVPESVIVSLKKVLAVMLPVNMFLLGCEVFKEFYTGGSHSLSAHYLFFGIHGHGMLVPYIWSSIVLNTFAMVVFLYKHTRDNQNICLIAAGCCIIGIWIEKGMGLVIPGMIPSPLGDLVEYQPSWVETLVSLGIWSLGLIIFSLFVKAAASVEAKH